MLQVVGSSRIGDEILTHRSIYGVFLTISCSDAKCRREITSWVIPMNIEPVPVSPAEVIKHEIATAERRRDPGSCTSHIVFVVDQSGYGLEAKINFINLGCLLPLQKDMMTLALPYFLKKNQIHAHM